MKDEYIHFFVRKAVRRSPIINRGIDKQPELKALVLLYVFYVSRFMLYNSCPFLRLFCSLGCSSEASSSVPQV